MAESEEYSSRVPCWTPLPAGGFFLLPRDFIFAQEERGRLYAEMTKMQGLEEDALLSSTLAFHAERCSTRDDADVGEQPQISEEDGDIRVPDEPQMEKDDDTDDYSDKVGIAARATDQQRELREKNGRCSGRRGLTNALPLLPNYPDSWKRGYSSHRRNSARRVLFPSIECSSKVLDPGLPSVGSHQSQYARLMLIGNRLN